MLHHWNVFNTLKKLKINKYLGNLELVQYPSFTLKIFLCERCLQFNWVSEASYRLLLIVSRSHKSIVLSFISVATFSVLGDKVWGRNSSCTDEMTLLSGSWLTGKVLHKLPVKRTLLCKASFPLSSVLESKSKIRPNFRGPGNLKISSYL